MTAAAVRPITLDAPGGALSALLSEPEQPPRAVVVALHGGGMTAGYFDGPAHPGASLLTLGAGLGFTVLAVDRPGYRGSADRLPHGQLIADQAAVLGAALDGFAARHDTGAGLLLLAHSYGGKVALTLAADRPPASLRGLDVSGCGQEFAVAPDGLANVHAPGQRHRHWGPLRLYPPGTFRSSGAIVAPMPQRERAEAARWPQAFRELAPRVRVPVRLTFAEHEGWWHHDEAAVARMAGQFTGAPRVVTDHQPDAGHNISLGWAARAYHLRALAFFEDCLVRAEAAPAARPLVAAS
ncbi:alpha/beta hydrolase [Streptomyces tateyamensis]|uniref:Alpha/beta hydrolase n=1 Tax=Streptomyces tateyamensis TaxID=565073 RepID=A0A2V4P2X8_9ACTN|nr:alpha/beta hydrolase [Streptomyces tateyamensis]PYC83794.1 alpha/beta hydrolase [Streptomyces tateyamensis]